MKSGERQLLPTWIVADSMTWLRKLFAATPLSATGGYVMSCKEERCCACTQRWETCPQRSCVRR